ALEAVAREGARLMGARLCSVLLLDGSREWLLLHACEGGSETYRSKPPLSVEESLVGVVIRRRKPLQVRDVQHSSLYQNTLIARQEGLVSLLSVPLVFSGTALGAICVYTAHRHSFSNEEIGILTS